jgi:hypothetical protein
MKTLGLLLLLMAWAMPTSAQNNPASAQDNVVTPQVVARKANVRAPPRPAAVKPDPTQQHAVSGDVAGGQAIPKPILEILADPRIDPNVAYILWQTSRKPMDTWTMAELGFVGQAAPTLIEAGVPIIKVQMLYQFWGLDPSDVFNPSLAANWQAQSTAFDPKSAAAAAAISSAECQVDISLMPVGTYRFCAGGGQ